MKTVFNGSCNMKLSKSGAKLDKLDELAPGVKGYAIEQNGAIYIPVIFAKNEGNGDVGRFLDNLVDSITWKFPNVISNKLREMLRRRGFYQRIEIDSEGDRIFVYVKEKK